MSARQKVVARFPSLFSADDARLGIVDRSRALILDGRLVLPDVVCPACTLGLHHRCTGEVWGDFTDLEAEWACGCSKHGDEADGLPVACLRCGSTEGLHVCVELPKGVGR